MLTQTQNVVLAGSGLFVPGDPAIFLPNISNPNILKVALGMQYLPRYENSWALVIGINRYQHANPLAYACADAESVSDILINNLGFPSGNVVLLLDEQATRDAIIERFTQFEKLGPNDRLFVFFAGHGTTRESLRGPVGFLVPVDGAVEKIGSLIRWDELTRNAEIIPAKHILFVMDACYSGLAIQRGGVEGERRFVSDMMQRLSRQVITAGKGNETVADGGGPSGKNSIFTGHLLEGLRGKAARNGVITASHLMNYVYEKVGNDGRSRQTPHFGHLDGDGDFVLWTPDQKSSSHAPKDELVKTVVERPEPNPDIYLLKIVPTFVKKNGYEDPEADSFGKNEWSNKLGFFKAHDGHDVVQKPQCWLSLVVEPVSNQQINLDLLGLSKKLRGWQPEGDEPYMRFWVPPQVITTSKSIVFYSADNSSERTGEECWKRFLRIERNGAIEYCGFDGVTHKYRPHNASSPIQLVRYIQLIGLAWTFAFVAKRILTLVGYDAGVRYLVNLVGARDSRLVEFSDEPGKEGKHWIQPFDANALLHGSPASWKCSDKNLQVAFELILSSFGEAESKKLIVELAEQFGLAYNHQSEPRCFNYGTDIFPWNAFQSPND